MEDSKTLGIYVHVPFCKQKCSYCDFPSYEGLQDYYESYVQALLGEIDLWANTYPLSTKQQVNTIYFGGGTPTELSIQQLNRILKSLHTNYQIDTNIEIAMEANPGEVTQTYLSDLYKLGVNRLSYGVQTFDDQLLKILRRTHDAKGAIEAIEMANLAGFTNINIDYIYALPGQTLKDLEANLQRLESLPVTHVSIYGLQLEEGTYLEKQVRDGQCTLPSEEETEAMYDYMVDTLPQYGFERYEISNFAKNQQYSRHNLRYWQYEDYLGFGAGAHSFYENIRRGNKGLVVPYIQDIENGHLAMAEEEKIDENRAVEDFCFLALRTKWGIHVPTFEAEFGQSFSHLYGDVVEDLLHKQLVQWNKNSLVLTKEGVKHGNYVFEQFLR